MKQTKRPLKHPPLRDRIKRKAMKLTLTSPEWLWKGGRLNRTVPNREPAGASCAGTKSMDRFIGRVSGVLLGE